MKRKPRRPRSECSMLGKVNVLSRYSYEGIEADSLRTGSDPSRSSVVHCDLTYDESWSRLFAIEEMHNDR